MRIHEFAKQMGVSSKEVLLVLEELGIGGKTASSSVPVDRLPLLRARLGGEATSPTPIAEVISPPPSVEAPPEQELEPEETLELVRIKVPITISAFATALDTDVENIISAAENLGESVSVEDRISPELAVLIGESWGYNVEVEMPEGAEEALLTAEMEMAHALAEPFPLAAVEEKFPLIAVEKPVIPTPTPRKRFVPRRVAPPDAPPRPPVVTILGHVDHGKTTLLDAIRETNVTAQEAGAITQHIGAYQVEINGKQITFIDTPGHEAFTAMRARGAQVTDIAVLVVAADDGVMPQTLEAIDHAQAAGVPIIAAINKMDRPTASLDAIKQRLTEKGLVPEEWGGETIYVPISALQKTGIDDLLEMILVVAEVSDLRAVREGLAEGVVLEAKLDRRRGVVATLLVQVGTLKAGEALVAGSVAGKIRAMSDDRGRRLTEAGPSTPVEVIGFSDVPEPSELFRVVVSDREARALAEARRMEEREAELAVGPSSMVEISQLLASGESKVFNLILKADAQGTVEAISGALAQMQSEEVSLKLLHSGVGEVTESDVSLAATSKPTVILAFHVGADTQARRLAADERIEIRRYEVIYDLLDDVRQTMMGMLEAVYEEFVIGRAEVRALFRSSRVGTIAGCYVLEGRLLRGEKVRVRRGQEVLFEGKLDSMRYLKEDVTERVAGFECGIVLQEFTNFELGDIIECVEEREVRRTVL